MPSDARSSGLVIAVYDDGAALWNDLRGAWQADPSARLVVGSALRRQRLLSDEVAAHGTVLGGSLDSIERLWHEVARRCDVPEPVDDVELTAWSLHQHGGNISTLPLQEDSQAEGQIWVSG